MLLLVSCTFCKFSNEVNAFGTKNKSLVARERRVALDGTEEMNCRAVWSARKVKPSRESALPV